MSAADETTRITTARMMLERLATDHATVTHESVLNATLDYLARMVVILEPRAGAVESFLATFAGGLVAGTAVGLPFAGLATALTLLAEKSLDAGLLAWAQDRIAAGKV